MCIFTGAVDRVSGTSIFARHLPDGRQALVCAMSVVAPREVALVLPLPIAAGTAGAIELVDFASYPDLFGDLSRGFEGVRSAEDEDFLFDELPGQTLVVHEVGAAAASIVPSRGDFARLDKRFRIPDRVFARVPAYADYAFAVYQLRADDYVQDLHPLAVTFRSREPHALYFPTLHAHDGATIPAAAPFDHALYCQTGAAPDAVDWSDSDGELHRYVDVARTQGLVDPGPARRKLMSGTFINEDVWLRG